MPRQYNRRYVERVIGPSIAYVPLTLDKRALIDSADTDLVDQFTWFAHHHHTGSFYAYSNTKGRNRTGLKLHRWIMGNPESQVDHINGDPLDNRRCNLRLVNASQNSKNARVRKDNSSGHKCIAKRGNKWRIQIQSEYGRYGRTCITLEEAINVRDYLLRELHGDFARIA
jgi:hypothetical protein